MTKKVTRQTRHQHRAREEDGPFAVELELAAEDHVKPNGHGQKNHVPMAVNLKLFGPASECSIPELQVQRCKLSRGIIDPHDARGKGEVETIRYGLVAGDVCRHRLDDLAVAA
jgi:hypothetical protein